MRFLCPPRRALYKATLPLVGRGIHGGKQASVQIFPGNGLPDGIHFYSENQPLNNFPLSIDQAIAVPHRSCVKGIHTSIQTVEHLLAALAFLGIFKARIDVTGNELPILDGCALPYFECLQRTSHIVLPTPSITHFFKVIKSFRFHQGQAVCHLEPTDNSFLELKFVQNSPLATGKLRLSYLELMDETLLSNRYLKARTFGDLAHHSRLNAKGLARGATFSNTLVYHNSQIQNAGGSRFSDESLRHKILDALGDLMLLGAPFLGGIKLQSCSHRFMIATLKQAIREGALALQ